MTAVEVNEMTWLYTMSSVWIRGYFLEDTNQIEELGTETQFPVKMQLKKEREILGLNIRK
jgi:hypothetical protein